MEGNCGNVSDRQPRLIKPFAVAILPANLLDHSSVIDNFFAHAEAYENPQGVGPHRNGCSHFEECRSLLEDFWFEAEMPEREGRT